GLQDRFLLLALVGILLSQANDGAQRLDVVAVALGFRIDIADVVGDGFLFLLQPLDPLDDGFELVLGEARRLRFVRFVGLDGGRGGHRLLLINVSWQRKGLSGPGSSPGSVEALMSDDHSRRPGSAEPAPADARRQSGSRSNPRMTLQRRGPAVKTRRSPSTAT